MSEHDEPPEWLNSDEPDTQVVSIDRERAQRGLPAGPASGWEASLVYETKGRGELKLAPTPGNLALHLINEPAWAGCLGYDQFAEREVWLREPPALPGIVTPKVGEVHDEHDTYVQHWFHAKRGFNVAAVTTAVIAAARSNGFHPVRSYLRAQVWDGKVRLFNWLTTYFGCHDSEYTRQVGMRWMVSAVARVMQPGCQADSMLVLEGAQGKGKSTGFEALVGKTWFSDTKQDLSKTDAYQAMRGKWIIEMAELDALKNQELTRIKAFLSARSDNYRPSYGKRARDFPRQTVFAGSTNEANYLRDPTGNRRFWPMATGEIDVPAIHRDRDQLWAEAVTHYDQGQVWYLDTPELRTLAEEQQAERMVDEHPWVELVGAWLAKVESPQGVPMLPGMKLVDIAQGVTTTDVLLGAGLARKESLGRSEATIVGGILRSLGLIRRRNPIGSREYRYFRPVPSQEIGRTENA